MPNNSSRNEYGSKPVSISLNGQKVSSVTKDENDAIQSFHLADGSELSYQAAIQAVQSGNAEGLIVQKGNQGQTILRSKPDGDDSNNLDNLPTMR